MNCPRCKSDKIDPFKHQGIEFDFCTDCKGIWCDQGELAEYVETINDLPKKVDLKEEGSPSEMVCPKCNIKSLYEIPYLKNKEVLIDQCAQCSGIWLDFKELAAIQKLAVNVDAKGKLERTLSQMRKKGFNV